MIFHRERRNKIRLESLSPFKGSNQPHIGNNFWYSNLDCRQKETPITSKTNATQWHITVPFIGALCLLLSAAHIPITISLSLSLFVLYHLFCLFPTEKSHHFHNSHKHAMHFHYPILYPPRTFSSSSHPLCNNNLTHLLTFTNIVTFQGFTISLLTPTASKPFLLFLSKISVSGKSSLPKYYPFQYS